MQDDLTAVIRPMTANLFQDKDLFTKMDPYVTLKINGHKKKTSIHRSGGKKPVWKDEFQFDLNGISDLLRVTVKDHDRFKWDDHIGSCTIDLKEDIKRGKSKLWYELSRKDKKIGSIQIFIASKAFLALEQSGARGGINGNSLLNLSTVPKDIRDHPYGVPEGALEMAFGDGAFKTNPNSANRAIRNSEVGIRQQPFTRQSGGGIYAGGSGLNNHEDRNHAITSLLSKKLVSPHLQELTDPYQREQRPTYQGLQSNLDYRSRS